MFRHIALRGMKRTGETKRRFDFLRKEVTLFGNL